MITTFQSHFLTQKYVDWLNDKFVTRYSEQRHHHHTLNSCANYYKSFKDTENYFLAIVSKEKSIGHIGNITAMVDTPNSIVDMSIMIGDRRLWGRGIGLRAWRETQKLFLERLKFRKVTAGTMIKNVSMLQIFEKSHMEIDCVRPKLLLLDNEEVDVVYASKYNTHRYSTS